MTKQSFRLKSYVIIYIQQKNSHPYGKGAPTSCKGSPYIQQRKSLHVAKEASHTAKGAIDTQKAGTYIGSVAKRCGKSIQSCIFASMESTMLEQLARIVLPSEILERFEIVQIETDEEDIDSMSMTIHLDERMNAEYQANDGYESLGFIEAVSVTDFPIRDHKVVLKLRRRRWKNKQTGESFVEKISVTEKGTRYSKEFAAFLKETYGDIPSDLPYA